MVTVNRATFKLRQILPKVPEKKDKIGRNAVQERTQAKLIKHHKPPSPDALASSCSEVESLSCDNSNSFSDNSSKTTNVLSAGARDSIKERTYPKASTDANNQFCQTSFSNGSQKNQLLDCQLSNLRNTRVSKNDASIDQTSISKAETTKEPSQDNDSKVGALHSCSSSGSLHVKDFEVRKNTIQGSLTFCFVCNIEFGSPDLLQSHKESNKFFCRVCVVQFSKHNELEIHLKSHKPFKCKTCKALFFSKKDLFQHKEANKQCNFRLECECCKKKFYEERCLKLHIKRYHSNSTEIYECVVCSKTFNSFDVYNYHLKRIHQAYEHLQCQICNILMVGPDRLKQHFKTTHLEAAEGDICVCPICKKMCSTKSLLRNHMEIHDNTVRLCEICGKSVEGKQPMRRHMTKEHSKTGFNCTKCKQQLSSWSELQKHVKNHRKPVDESVYCEVCGKKLKSPSTLKIHLQIHSDDKPFKCDICGACFKQEVTLKTHHRVHSDLGKYFCNVCGMSFRWKQTFDKHVKKCIAGGHSSLDEQFLCQTMQPQL